jgi:hypothetical protein
MLRMLTILLRIVLSFKCLRINNVKDVKPFTRYVPFAFLSEAIKTNLQYFLLQPV